MIQIPINAFAPMMEEVEWKERKAPYRTALVRAIVQHWRKQIEVYETIGNGVVKRYSDTWTVIIPDTDASAADMKVADTLTRQTGIGEKLTIQSVAREGNSWIMACTVNQNAGG